ncbi:MAG TPA: hypothetical protein DCS29_02735 [Candidatus Magasanikbacteria bacterium]|nr:MAG: hypothetical protein A2479_00240 [Candidatus Magasanikbacteria bacterium RIFOXYC2_FULL_39_8]HAT03669.1 hypothetical protein [Candidatus Magasanikbacteria bacterium]
MEQKQTQVGLSSGQKTGFVLLLVFALLTVGLTFFQVRNTIYSPFVVKVDKEALAAKKAFEFDETTRLQQIDTDHDGLNDYEELFFYETSPYLPDTDSDGIEDKAELDQGKNPLCPEGKACDSAAFDASATSSTEFIVSPLLDDSQTAADILVNSQLSGQLNTGANALGAGVDFSSMISDPAVLRQMLITTGKISKEELSAISDEQLMLMAQQLAKNQFGATTSTPQ